MSLNRVCLIGRLTRNPELKYTTTGIAVANLGIAVDRFTKDAEGNYETDFFNITAWRQTAEFAEKYLTKGRLVSIDGRLQMRSWIDQSTQVKRTAVDIVADHINGLDKRPDEANPEGHPDVVSEEPIDEAMEETQALPSAPIVAATPAPAPAPVSRTKAPANGKSNGATAVAERPIETAAAPAIDPKAAKIARLKAEQAAAREAKIEAELAAALAEDGDPFDTPG